MTDKPEDWNIETYATSLPEAREVERLESLGVEMLFVVEYLKRLITTAADDPTAQSAYLTSALITYRRCFSEGARAHLANSDAESLRSNANGIHAYVRAQADKYAAHSVNSFRQTRVGVLVRDGKEVSGVGSLTGQLLSLSGPQIHEWGKLAEDIQNNVLKPRILAARKALEESARKLPIEEVKRGQILRLTVDPAADPKQKRA